MKKHFLFIFLFLLSNIIYGQHYKKDGTPDKRYKENHISYALPARHTYSSSHSRRSNYAYFSARDSNGKIKRNPKARYEFMKQSGYSHGRKGYVIDHIIPLKKGGCDCPSNMQWQTKEAAREKDKWE